MRRKPLARLLSRRGFPQRFHRIGQPIVRLQTHVLHQLALFIELEAGPNDLAAAQQKPQMFHEFTANHDGKFY